MRRTLVLDASQRSALAVTRSLGSAGVPIITAEETIDSLASHSRYSSQQLSYPSPRLHPEDFVNSIVHTIESYDIQCIYPMTELTSLLLLENREKLLGANVPIADIATVDLLSDKIQLMRRAEALNIPVPQTLYVDNPENLPVDPEKLRFPLVLKPAKSWIRHNGEWKRAAVHIIKNAIDFNDTIRNSWEFESHPYMIQEFIPGEGQGVFALYDNGSPVCFFSHHRIREKPPSGGVSVLSESVPTDPTMESYTKSLLESAGWHGVAMVEFKVSRDGIPYLMEINTRFWGSLQLSVDAGIDFPYLLYQICCGGKPDSITGYKVGNRLRWLLGDLDNLYLSLNDSSISVPNKLKRILAFITPFPINTRHEIFRWSDPAPAWFEARQYIRELFRSYD